MDHNAAIRVHFERSLLQRYGIECTYALRVYMKEQISKDQATFLHRKPDGTEQWRVVLEDGTKIIVVYDPVIDQLVTTLTSGMYKKSKKQNKKKRNPKRNKKTNWEL